MVRLVKGRARMDAHEGDGEGDSLRTEKESKDDNGCGAATL